VPPLVVVMHPSSGDKCDIVSVNPVCCVYAALSEYREHCLSFWLHRNLLVTPTVMADALSVVTVHVHLSID